MLANNLLRSCVHKNRTHGPRLGVLAVVYLNSWCRMACERLPKIHYKWRR